jgi:16S rRNA (cytidine1402-2'-O)-methyltransferase
MPGTLHVVATPIGNLEDITLRALRVLREVAVVAAEDTRRTAKLLGHYGITTPTISYHDHNSKVRMPLLLDRLGANEDVALVTDAGTPGVSDPGAELVGACVRAQIPVDPVPGVSAPLAAALASGFPLIPLTIFGFPPTRPKNRTAWFEDVCRTEHTLSFFEAPHRIGRTLNEIGPLLGERQILIAREVTKLHEEFVRGLASSIATAVTSRKGEFTIVVGPAIQEHSVQTLTDDEIATEFGRITDNIGLRRREAISMLAKQSRRSARDIYAVIEKAKQSGV